MKRPQRHAPTGNELRPASAPEQSALAIASAEIERLTAENEKLRSGANSAPHTPDLKVEAALYKALQFERAKVKALRRQIDSNELAWKKFRANRLARAVTANMTPNDGSQEKQ